MCEILVLENGRGTYWGSIVGLLGSIETPFETCGHEFKLELVVKMSKPFSAQGSYKKR